MLTIVTGPPCAGKTTWVRQHAKPGDIIVDFDLIAQAVGSPVTHGHDRPLWKVAIEARQAAITAAVGQARQGATAWVIDSRPTEPARQAYLKAGAGRPDSWHRRIDEFLAGPDPPPRRRHAW
jgi:hypothetical protein